MIYILYKGKVDKFTIEYDIRRINKLLYKNSEEALKKFYKNVTLINHLYFTNSDLLLEINNDSYYIHNDGNNLYYKFYDLSKNDVRSIELRSIIQMYTYINSNKDDSIYLNLFYDEFNNYIYNKLSNKEETDIFADISRLGLIAFSNNVNIYENNDLVKGFLYDRKYPQTKYEDVMGKGSFERLNRYGTDIRLSYALNNEILPEKIYLSLLDDLKKYFDEKMKNKIDISLGDKSLIISSFYELYNKLMDDYKTKNKKTF